MIPEGIPSAWQQVQEEFACDHEQSEIRLVVASNGVKHYRDQCLRCGDFVRSVRVRAVPLAVQMRPAAWDEALRQRWCEARQARFGELQEERKAVEREEWRERYRKYLASPAWAIKRARVLERAGNLCEGCRKCPPVEVHHLTYVRMGREMLFDLVAVCRRCHEAIHDHGGEEG